MNWILDLALVAFYIIIVLVNVQRGFLKSVWGLAQSLVSLFAAYLFGQELGTWLYNTYILKYFTGLTFDTLKPMVEETDGIFNLSGLFDRLPEGFRNLVENYGADGSSLEESFGAMEHASETDVSELASYIAEPVARSISTISGYVLVFFSALLLMFIVGRVVILIAELPVIHEVNAVFGGLLGCISGLIYIWIICLCLSIFLEKGLAEAPQQALRSIAEDSYIFRFFCNLSPFDFVNIKSIIQ